MTTAGLKRALGYFVRQAEIYVLCIIGEALRWQFICRS